MIGDAQGIFANQGTGCAGCDGLGAMTSGIFAGPTALGFPLAQFRGLGAITVPADCWKVPGFEQASQNCFAQAQQTCDYVEGCTEVENDKCLQSFINATKCGAAAPPVPVTPPVVKPPVYNPPVYNPPVTTPPVAAPPVVVAPPVAATGGTMAFFTSKFMGLPMYAWFGVGGVLIGVFVAMSRSKSAGYQQGFGY